MTSLADLLRRIVEASDNAATGYEPIPEDLITEARAAIRGPEARHCATCQCNKLHDTAKRVPDNPQSKTWHW